MRAGPWTEASVLVPAPRVGAHAPGTCMLPALLRSEKERRLGPWDTRCPPALPPVLAQAWGSGPGTIWGKFQRRHWLPVPAVVGRRSWAAVVVRVSVGSGRKQSLGLPCGRVIRKNGKPNKWRGSLLERDLGELARPLGPQELSRSLQSRPQRSVLLAAAVARGGPLLWVLGASRKLAEHLGKQAQFTTRCGVGWSIPHGLSALQPADEAHGKRVNTVLGADSGCPTSPS